MIVGPVLTIGGLVALFLILGGKVPNLPSGVEGKVAMLAVLALLTWRVSLVFGPKKDCNRCGASGARRGLLGGKKPCARCDGSGLRDRIGAKK